MLGNGFLPMFAQGGAAANVWTGATWAVSGDNAYNVPAPGAELMLNNGFEGTFTSGLAANWLRALGSEAVSSETSSPRSGNAAQKVNTLASSAGIFQYRQAALTTGRWYTCGVWGRSNTGSITLSIRSNGLESRGIIANSSWQYVLSTFRYVSGNTGVYAYASSAAAAEFFLDDASLTQLTTAQLFATISGSSSAQTAAAKIATLTSGIQSGVVALLDSASNPQNFLNAYHNGTSVLLDKCVAGTYTNLITTTVAFTANAQIEIRRPSGNTFQLWYNGTQRGTNQTVADTGIINNTRYGLFGTHSGGTFSEFSLGGVVIPFGLPGA